MIIGLWSNDPEFYEHIVGEDMSRHIFLKSGGDIDSIINRFQLQKINENFYKSSKHLCVIGDDTKEVLNQIKTEIENINEQYISGNM